MNIASFKQFKYKSTNIPIFYKQAVISSFARGIQFLEKLINLKT